MTLSEYFRSTYPGADQLTKKEFKAQVTTVAMRSGNHRKGDGSRFFSRTFFKDIGTSYASFANSLAKINTFHVDKCGSKGKRQTHAYYFTNTTKFFLINYACSLSNEELIKTDEKLNVRGVKDFMLSTQDIDKAVECAQFLIAHSQKDLLDIEYKQHSCGRKFAIGNYVVQRTPKWLREIAFSGWYDVDVQNCVVSIANHFGNFPAFDEYVKDTEALRQRVAQDCGVSPKAVKMSLLSLLFGAKQADSKDSALRKHLGKGKVKAFISHPFVQRYIKDCADVKQTLLNKASEFGIVGSGDASTCAQVLMHYENMILEAATCNVDDAVLMFDGFMTQEQVDVHCLEKQVFDNTGFSVTLTQDLI